jgi:hypothetical protein
MTVKSHVEIVQEVLEKYKSEGTIGSFKPENEEHALRVANAIAYEAKKETEKATLFMNILEENAKNALDEANAVELEPKANKTEDGCVLTFTDDGTVFHKVTFLKEAETYYYYENAKDLDPSFDTTDPKEIAEKIWTTSKRRDAKFIHTVKSFFDFAIPKLSPLQKFASKFFGFGDAAALDDARKEIKSKLNEGTGSYEVHLEDIDKNDTAVIVDAIIQTTDANMSFSIIDSEGYAYVFTMDPYEEDYIICKFKDEEPAALEIPDGVEDYIQDILYREESNED